MSKLFLIFFTFLVGIVIGLPMKDRDFNDWLQQNNLNKFNIYEDDYVDPDQRAPRTLDSLGGGYLLRNSLNTKAESAPSLTRTLDSLGGGYLLRNAETLDESNIFTKTKPRTVRVLDSLGGGYLLRSAQNPQSRTKHYFIKDEQSPSNRITLMKAKGKIDSNDGDSSNYYAPRITRSFDIFAEENSVKSLDSIGGGHLIKRTLDSIGGANLLKK